MSGWVIVGVLSLGVAVGQFFEYLKLQHLIRQLEKTKVYKAAQLQALVRSRQRSESPLLVQVTGKVVCAQPLFAELSQRPCVYYTSEVTWDYEETRYCRKTLDDKGNVIREEYMRDRPEPSDYSYGTSYSSYKSYSQKPNREMNIERKKSSKKSSIERSDIEKKKSDFHSSDLLRYPAVGYQYTEGGRTYWVVEENKRDSETIHKVTRSIPFYVQDETGRLRVDITGGEVESVAVVDEQTNAPSNVLTINYGTFSMSLANYSAASSEGYRKPRRFNYKESLLPLDTFVTITGQVASEGGEAVIRKPRAGGQLLVSLQSGNELLAKKKNEAQTSLGVSATGLVIGIICLIIGGAR